MEHPRVGIGVFVWKEGKILMQLRKGEHGKDTWSPIGGKLDYNEHPEECAVRETMEESGVHIHNLRFAGMTNDVFSSTAQHWVTLYYHADWKKGEAKVMEPDKHEELIWADPNNLPEPLFPSLKSYVGQFGVPKRVG